jgi:hypothetical protein
MELVYVLLVLLAAVIICTPLCLTCHPSKWAKNREIRKEVKAKRKARARAALIHVEEAPKNRKRKHDKTQETWHSKSKSEFAQRVREQKVAQNPKMKKHKNLDGSPIRKAGTQKAGQPLIKYGIDR